MDVAHLLCLLEESRSLAAVSAGVTHNQTDRVYDALAKARDSTGLARAALAQ